MSDADKSKAFYTYKVLFYIIASVSLFVNIWLVTVLLQANNENEVLRDTLALRQDELRQKHEEEVRKHQHLDHFMRDEEYRNRIARDRLGYLRPDEFIFRFKDEGNLDSGRRN